MSGDTRQHAEKMERCERAAAALLAPLREAVAVLATDTSYDGAETLHGRVLVQAGYAHHRLAALLVALEEAMGDAGDMARTYATHSHSALYRRQVPDAEVAP